MPKYLPIEAEVPKAVLHSNHGTLIQDLLQLPEATLRRGDEHPFYPNIIYLQTNLRTGKQQWTTRIREKLRKHKSRYQSLRRYYLRKHSQNQSNDAN